MEALSERLYEPFISAVINTHSPQIGVSAVGRTDAFFVGIIQQLRDTVVEKSSIHMD